MPLSPTYFMSRSNQPTRTSSSPKPSRFIDIIYTSWEHFIHSNGLRSISLIVAGAHQWTITWTNSGSIPTPFPHFPSLPPPFLCSICYSEGGGRGTTKNQISFFSYIFLSVSSFLTKSSSRTSWDTWENSLLKDVKRSLDTFLKSGFEGEMDKSLKEKPVYEDSHSPQWIPSM